MMGSGRDAGSRSGIQSFLGDLSAMNLATSSKQIAAVGAIVLT